MAIAQTTPTTVDTQKVKLRIFFIISAGILLILGAYWSSEAYLARKKIEIEAISNTRKDIELFADAIKVYIQDKEKLPFKPPEDKEFIVSPKSIYPVLFKSKMNSLEMIDPPSHWKINENIVDRWNNELNMLVKVKDIPEAGDSVKYYHLTIWSNGPNQINDNGEKDDITGSFLIEFWIETPRVQRPISKP